MVRNQNKFQRRGGSIKIEKLSSGNVAEPDLWDIWPLEIGPAAAHILIIHSVKEIGGNVQQKRVFGIDSKSEIFPRQQQLNFHTDATKAE